MLIIIRSTKNKKPEFGKYDKLVCANPIGKYIEYVVDHKTKKYILKEKNMNAYIRNILEDNTIKIVLLPELALEYKSYDEALAMQKILNNSGKNIDIDVIEVLD